MIIFKTSNWLLWRFTNDGFLKMSISCKCVPFCGKRDFHRCDYMRDPEVETLSQIGWIWCDHKSAEEREMSMLLAWRMEGEDRARECRQQGGLWTLEG